MAKDLKYSEDARRALESGVNKRLKERPPLVHSEWRVCVCARV